MHFQSTQNDVGYELMMQYLAYTRATHLWFHGAHHSVRGVSFAGDHVELFGRIYSKVEESFDGAAEKAVGLFDESIVDPCGVTTLAANIMSKYPPPSKLSSHGMSRAGCMLIADYLAFVEHMFETLESQGQLSLGLNDFLAAAANNLETYVYLLKQRKKQDDGMADSAG
jgi:DNA-binding ferritin-like protein